MTKFTRTLLEAMTIARKKTRMQSQWTFRYLIKVMQKQELG